MPVWRGNGLYGLQRLKQAGIPIVPFQPGRFCLLQLAGYIVGQEGFVAKREGFSDQHIRLVTACAFNTSV